MVAVGRKPTDEDLPSHGQLNDQEKESNQELRSSNMNGTRYTEFIVRKEIVQNLNDIRERKKNKQNIECIE